MKHTVFITLFMLTTGASLIANRDQDQVESHLISYVDALRAAFKDDAPADQPIFQGTVSVEEEAKDLMAHCKTELEPTIVQLKATADAWWDYENQRAGNRKDLDAIHEKMRDLSDECKESIYDTMRNIYERLINLSRYMER